MDINFSKLTAEELYAIAVELGQLSQTRPDITHRFIVGLRDGLDSWGGSVTFNDIYWSLWRHGEYHCLKENLSIPFTNLTARPSGVVSK